VLASGKNIYPDEVEDHYETCDLVRELCVMAEEEPSGRATRLSAVVVPDFDELRRRKVTSAHGAIRQEFAQIAQGLPSYMRLHRIKLVRDELPRTRLGKLKRSKIEKMAFEEVDEAAPASLSAEDQALMSQAGASDLLDRLKELSGSKRDIVPSDHLELDLGFDSLTRIELGVLLENEFGVKIPEEEAIEVTTVRDVLEKLSGGKASASERSWREILSERADPALSEMFDLDRSPLVRASLNGLRHCALRAGQRAFPLDARGFENLPKEGPFLLCPTHASLMDAVLVYVSMPDDYIERVFFLGAEEYFRTPLMRLIGRLGHVIPTATADTVLASMQRAAEALEMGLSVCIFPEGAVTRDGYLQEPRPGAGILACQFGAPIVPLLIRGTFDTFSHTHPGLRLVPLGLTCGQPIRPPRKEKYTNEDYAAVVEQWSSAVARMRLEDDASGSLTAGRSPRLPEDM